MKHCKKSSFNSFDVKMNEYSFRSTVAIMIGIVLSIIVLMVGFLGAVYLVAPHMDNLWNETTVICEK